MAIETETKSRGLYSLLLRRLEEARRKCNKETIPFPNVFSKICSNFSINKKECWELLYFVREMGLIEIVPYHGIRIVDLKEVIK